MTHKITTAVNHHRNSTKTLVTTNTCAIIFLFFTFASQLLFSSNLIEWHMF